MSRSRPPRIPGVYSPRGAHGAGASRGQAAGLGMLAAGNPTSRVVVGLGNEGREYARTRHNVGAMAVARAVEALGLRAGPGLLPVPGSRSGLVLPDGFMNESGRLVRRAVERWRPPASGLLVVHDDLEVPLGVVQEKEGGGHGGHNGLRDVMAVLGTGAFRRVRIGIGRPPGRMDPADFVLAPFRPEEREAIEQAIGEACAVVLGFLRPPADGPRVETVLPSTSG